MENNKFTSKSWGANGDADLRSAVRLYKCGIWETAEFGLHEAAEQYARSIIADSGGNPGPLNGLSLYDSVKAYGFTVLKEENTMLKYLICGPAVLHFHPEIDIPEGSAHEVCREALALVKRIRAYALQVHRAQQESKPAGIKRLTLE